MKAKQEQTLKWKQLRNPCILKISNFIQHASQESQPHFVNNFSKSEEKWWLHIRGLGAFKFLIVPWNAEKTFFFFVKLQVWVFSPNHCLRCWNSKGSGKWRHIFHSLFKVKTPILCYQIQWSKWFPDGLVLNIHKSVSKNFSHCSLVSSSQNTVWTLKHTQPPTAIFLNCLFSNSGFIKRKSIATAYSFSWKLHKLFFCDPHQPIM